jgi:hypothetical protein
MSFRDEFGLPRRELGAGFLALMIVGATVALLIVHPSSEFGYGATAIAFLLGAGVCLFMTWFEGERGELFLPSPQIRLERYERSQQRRTRVISGAAGAIAFLAISMVPDRYRAVAFAFVIGGLAVILTIFVVDRWIVLPRQLAEQSATA